MRAVLLIAVLFGATCGLAAPLPIYAQDLLRRFDGQAAGDNFGAKVNNAGDTNKDGLYDVIVSAPLWDQNALQPDKGHIYVLSMVPGPFGAALLEGQGPSIGDKYADGVSGAGDVNGDGFPDVVAGTKNGDPNTPNTTKIGTVYIDSGNPADLNPTNSYAKVLEFFSGGQFGDELGESVAAAGDVNGDGLGDVIAGATQGGLNAAGYVRVYRGSAAGSLLYQFASSVPGDYFGDAVSGSGDIDADGVPDFIIGASQRGNNGPGYVQAISGASGATLYTWHGELAGDWFGYSVSHAGDLNYDGYDDIVIGAPRHSGQLPGAGKVYVYSGKQGVLMWSVDGEAANDNLGYSVSSTSYLYTDSFPRVLAGAPFADHSGVDSGSAYVFSGTQGLLMLRLDGYAVGDRFGNSLASAGDFDGNGKTDLVVGAPQADNSALDSGSVYIFTIPDRIVVSPTPARPGAQGGVPVLNHEFGLPKPKVVVKDHISNSINYLFPESYFYEQHDLGGLGQNQQVMASTFIGNGGRLATLSGVFLKDGGIGFKNGGSWNDWGFRVVFYDDNTSFVENSAIGTSSVIFDAPDNSNWQYPIQQWNGWELYEFSFNLKVAGIYTTPGQQHLVSIVPFQKVPGPGKTYMMYSGGLNALEFSDDWYEGKPAIPPGIVSQTLLVGQRWGAYRVKLFVE